MTTLLRLSRAPECLSCLRKLVAADSSFIMTAVGTQTRGKKRKARLPTTLNAKLLKDTTGFGRKGSIVPVAPGRMRNIWYPRGIAEYVTNAQLKTMPNVVVERDFTFGVGEGPTESAALERKPLVEVPLLSPQRTSQLLESNVPEVIEFYRKPVSAVELQKGSSAKVAELHQEGTKDFQSSGTLLPTANPKPTNLSIHGSVSTLDIVSIIKAMLSLKSASPDTPDLSRIVLHAEDISIIRPSGELVAADRVKELGNFDITINVKGGGTVRREMMVLPEQ